MIVVTVDKRMLLADYERTLMFGDPCGYPKLSPNFYGTLIQGMQDQSGYVYQRNRYLNPSTGQFTQEDPLGLAGGLNVYGFASGDPVNYSDPFGLCSPSWLCTWWDDYQAWRSEQIKKSEEWQRAHGGKPVEVGFPSWMVPAGAAEEAASVATKAVNLPAWKTIAIDMEHIASGHMTGGERVSALKTLFPEGMSAEQVERLVRQAYRYGSERLATQGDRVLLRGRAFGMTIEMWVNRAEKVIETAYPVSK